MPSTTSNLVTRMFRTLGLQRPQHEHNLSQPPETPNASQGFVQCLRQCMSPHGQRIGLPPHAIANSPKLYSQQASSPLFSKLPIEIRDIIWEFCVGGQTIHMFWRDRDSLLAFVCEKQSPCISIAHEGNRGVQGSLMWGSANNIRERDIVQEKGFMNLLVTCRAVYFEATKILYSRNTFDFTDHWPNVRYLSWNIPLSALSAITSITARCEGVELATDRADLSNVPTVPTIRADFINWAKMWETLALLKCLRSLTVEMVPALDRAHPQTTIDEYVDMEDALLAPVKKIEWTMRSGVREFELRLPWEGKAGGEVRAELEEMGWKITRV